MLRREDASPPRSSGPDPMAPQSRDAAPSDDGPEPRGGPTPGGKDDGGNDEPDEDDRSTLQKGRDFVRRHPLGTGIAALVVVAAMVAALLWYLHARHFEETDDAFVDARSFSVAAKVSGYLTAVPVEDNQHLDAGALVGQIDTRDYQVAVDQAQAQVEAAAANVDASKAQLTAQEAQVTEAAAQVTQSEAAVQFARDENARAQELVQRGAGTVQRAQQTASELTQNLATLARSQAARNAANAQLAVIKAQGKQAEGNLAQANAQLAQARLNLDYTRVTVAQSGRIARLSAARGQLVQAGQALSMFVPDELWVTANFKETQLADMRPGQSVDLTIDAYPGRALTGKVDSIQRGSGTVFSLLPAQNATGNYVKVVQRVPVKIVFDAMPADVAIGPGMSVVPKVRVR